MPSQSDLAEAVVRAGERLGQVMNEAGDLHALGAVPREKWNAIAEAALKLWEAATAAAEGARAGDRDYRPWLD